MRASSFSRCCAGLAVALLTPVAVQAQSNPNSLTQDELLRQIESLSPAASDPGRRTPGVIPIPGGGRASGRMPAPAPEATSLFPEADGAGKSRGEKKAKGATEIVALEATFDQKAHVAIFIGEVVVRDPEFNVQADKLTAYLKQDDKAHGAANSGRLQTGGGEAKPKGKGGKDSGGLEKALAEANPGGMVVITQEKEEADGSITRSIGRGRKVLYDSVTGDITLYGRPDVQQGINTCIATEDSTVMILNRDGHMRVNGAHKTVIKDQSDKK